MEEKRIKEIEHWIDRYVNRECSKMEAVEGIESEYRTDKTRQEVRELALKEYNSATQNGMVDKHYHWHVWKRAFDLGYSLK